VARQEREAAAAAAEEAERARESALQAVAEIEEEAAAAAKAMEEDVESTDDETFEQAMPPPAASAPLPSPLQDRARGTTDSTSGSQGRTSSQELGPPSPGPPSYTPLLPDVLYQGWFEKANRLSEAARPFQRRLAVTWPFAKVGDRFLVLSYTVPL